VVDKTSSLDIAVHGRCFDRLYKMVSSGNERVMFSLSSPIGLVFHTASTHRSSRTSPYWPLGV